MRITTPKLLFSAGQTLDEALLAARAHNSTPLGLGRNFQMDLRSNDLISIAGGTDSILFEVTKKRNARAFPSLALLSVLQHFLTAGCGIAVTVLTVVFQQPLGSKSNATKEDRDLELAGRVVLFAASVVGCVYVPLHLNAATYDYSTRGNRASATQAPGRHVIAVALLLARMGFPVWIASVAINALVAIDTKFELGRGIPGNVPWMDLFASIAGLVTSAIVLAVVEASERPFITAAFSPPTLLYEIKTTAKYDPGQRQDDGLTSSKHKDNINGQKVGNGQVQRLTTAGLRGNRQTMMPGFYSNAPTDNRSRGGVPPALTSWLDNVSEETPVPAESLQRPQFPRIRTRSYPLLTPVSSIFAASPMATSQYPSAAAFGGDFAWRPRRQDLGSLDQSGITSLSQYDLQNSAIYGRASLGLSQRPATTPPSYRSVLKRETEAPETIPTAPPPQQEAVSVQNFSRPKTPGSSLSDPSQNEPAAQAVPAPATATNEPASSEKPESPGTRRMAAVTLMQEKVGRRLKASQKKVSSPIKKSWAARQSNLLSPRGAGLRALTQQRLEMHTEASRARGSLASVNTVSLLGSFPAPPSGGRARRPGWHPVRRI